MQQFDIFEKSSSNPRPNKAGLGLKKPRKKGEEKVQIKVCKYLREKYPNVIFTCDLASGMKLPIHIAAKNKSMRSSRGLPDLFIAHQKEKPMVAHYPQRYNGLFIELKNEGVSIYKKDGSLKKDPHLEEQNEILRQLMEQGYKAVFACGFEEAKKIIDEYLRN